MEIAISPQTERLIETILETGRYENMDEMLSTAVSMLLDLEESEKLARLRADIRIGIEQADRGECVEFDVEKTKERARQMLARKA